MTIEPIAVEAGCVCYRVDKVGAFTLGWDHTAYPHRADTDRVLVRMGAADGTEVGYPYRNRVHEWPEAPRINTITLVGNAFVKVQTVIDYWAGPADEDRWAWWLQADRLVPGVHGAQRLPDKTQRKAARIVAGLVDDYLHRDDADQLLHAHHVHHAPARIAKHREHLAQVQAEIAQWHARAVHEQGLLEAQAALLDLDSVDGAPLPDPLTGRPGWRDYRQALTREGGKFLIDTVGASPSRTAA